MIDLMDDKSELVETLPEPFNFYRMIFENDHLHFGYWPDDCSGISLEEAQDRLASLLKDCLPSPPAVILDVGCGFGATAGKLGGEGYQVTAISPSASMIEYAKANYAGPNVDFLVSGFCDADAVFLSKQYDILLFQESLQYLTPLSFVCKRAGDLLKKEGCVIIADEIRYDHSINDKTAVHGRLDVFNALAENGFSVIDNKKIGKQVKKTCEIIIHRFTEKFDDIVQKTGGEDAGKKLSFYINGWKSQKNWYENEQFGYETIVAKKTPVRIRSYREGDENQILDLFNRVFSPPRTMAHWRWKFTDNPYGAHHIALAVGNNDGPAANFCGYPVLIYDKHKSGEFMSQQLGDTMTNPDFRRMGFGKTNILTRTAHYYYDNYCLGRVPFSFGFNTGKIRKFGERFLEFTYLPDIPYHVLDISRIKDSNSFTAFISDRMLRGFTVEEVLSVTEEYDALFKYVRDDYVMLTVRNSRYLKWRYLECPDNRHRIFCVRRFGKLVGWSVFSKKNDILLWGDALFNQNYPASVRYLLGNVIRNHFPDVKRIEGWFSKQPGWWASILKKIGFEIVQEPDKIAPAIIFFSSEFTLDHLDRYWYYTKGDSDLF